MKPNNSDRGEQTALYLRRVEEILAMERAHGAESTLFKEAFKALNCFDDAHNRLILAALVADLARLKTPIVVSVLSAALLHRVGAK
jgi:hypothetical protein